MKLTFKDLSDAKNEYIKYSGRETNIVLIIPNTLKDEFHELIENHVNCKIKDVVDVLGMKVIYGSSEARENAGMIYVMDESEYKNLPKEWFDQ